MRSDKYKAEKKPIYKRPYTYFVLALLIICISVWSAVWNKLAYFESYSAQTLLSQLVEEVAASSKSDGEITYKKVAAKEPGQMSYDFYIDGENYANITLNPLEEKGFLGMGMYEIGERIGNRSMEFNAVIGSDLMIGGTPLSELSPVKDYVLPGLERLSSYSKNELELPRVGEYKINNLFDIPEIDGENMTQVYSDQGSFIAFQMPEDIVAEVEPQIEALTRNYSLFITNDQTFWPCSDYIVYNTPIHKQLRQLYVGDYTPHSSVKFGNFEFSEPILFTENFGAITLDYEFTVTGQYMTSEYTPTITYYIYNDGSKWKVIEMFISE